MTIFDFRPYSYWRRLYRQAHDVWLVTFGDTPRTVARLDLQERIIAHQNRMINYLERDNRELRQAYLRTIAQDGLESHRTPVLAPDTPASTVTSELAAILPATNEGSDHATAA